MLLSFALILFHRKFFPNSHGISKRRKAGESNQWRHPRSLGHREQEGSSQWQFHIGDSACSLSHVWLFKLQPTRLLCPWGFPGKGTGVGCHFILRGSSWPRDLTCVFCIGRRILYQWATRETHTNIHTFIQFSLTAFQDKLNLKKHLSQPPFTLRNLRLSLPGSSIRI